MNYLGYTMQSAEATTHPTETKAALDTLMVPDYQSPSAKYNPWQPNSFP